MGYCTVCAYQGNNRSFRNVGTSEHPEDEVCGLCDTKEDTDGQGGTETQEPEDSELLEGTQSSEDTLSVSLALWVDDQGWGRRSHSSPLDMPRKSKADRR